jgi:hypothetical protein
VNAQASGRAFLGLIRYVKDHGGGAPTLARVIEGAGPAARDTFAKPIRIMSWYPYAAFSGFLGSLERHLGKSDPAFCRHLGAAAGTRDLGTVFRIYRALASPERLIRACGKVWPSYYRDAGRMEAVAWEPDYTVLRIYDFPEMDPRHCRLMEGWMISTMLNIGCRVNDDGMERQCMRAGAPYHEFTCSWTRVG